MQLQPVRSTATVGECALYTKRLPLQRILNPHLVTWLLVCAHLPGHVHTHQLLMMWHLPGFLMEAHSIGTQAAYWVPCRIQQQLRKPGKNPVPENTADCLGARVACAAFFPSPRLETDSLPAPC